jgi:hypothetical protein
MTAIFFQDEVFLDCSKDLDSSECTFIFKGKEIYLKHTIEIEPKQRVHRMVCNVDDQTFSFGVGRSSLGGGIFGIWPKINIDGKVYRFKISWPLEESTKGIKLEPEENINSEDEIDEPSGRRKLQQLMMEIRNEFKDLKPKVKNQEELDDEEGFLHIHTLPPEARKKIIDLLKNKKK